MYHSLEWKLLYRMSEHGTSMITFMKRVKHEQTTVLVIEDENGFKFGAFCLEEWAVSK